MRLKPLAGLLVLLVMTSSAHAKTVVLGNFEQWTVECGAPASVEKADYCYLQTNFRSLYDSPEFLVRFSFDRDGHLLMNLRVWRKAVNDPKPEITVDQILVDHAAGPKWNVPLVCRADHKHCSVEKFQIPDDLAQSLRIGKSFQFKYWFGSSNQWVLYNLSLSGFKEGVARLREIAGFL